MNHHVGFKLATVFAQNEAGTPKATKAKGASSSSKRSGAASAGKRSQQQQQPRMIKQEHEGEDDAGDEAESDSPRRRSFVRPSSPRRRRVAEPPTLAFASAPSAMAMQLQQAPFALAAAGSLADFKLPQVKQEPMRQMHPLQQVSVGFVLFVLQAHDQPVTCLCFRTHTTAAAQWTCTDGD